MKKPRDIFLINLRSNGLWLYQALEAGRDLSLRLNCQLTLFEYLVIFIYFHLYVAIFLYERLPFKKIQFAMRCPIPQILHKTPKTDWPNLVSFKKYAYINRSLLCPKMLFLKLNFWTLKIEWTKPDKTNRSGFYKNTMHKTNEQTQIPIGAHGHLSFHSIIITLPTVGLRISSGLNILNSLYNLQQPKVLFTLQNL